MVVIKKISVIIPVYNVEKYLERCIKSIISQTYKDLEIILVDDGSTDSSGHICDNYAKQDNRIKVIHKTNGGLSDARNAGLDIATGEYISFIDGDDYIHPQTYKIMLGLMAEYDAEIGCFHYQFIQPDETAIDTKYDYDAVKANTIVISSEDFINNFSEYFRAVSWISACTKIYKRNIYDELRFPYGKVDEDSYMLHRAAAKSNKIIRADIPLYYYVWTQGSISRSDFSPKRFDKNGANLDRVAFFKELGIKQQENYFKREYLLNTLQMYYIVKNEHPEFLDDFKAYISEYRRHMKEFIKNNNCICNMEKVIYNAFSLSPGLTEILYNKYLK